jgi:hypothetical protein
MRKSVLLPVLLLALALPATALAQPAERGDRGDGTLAIKNAVGQVIVKATGTALGRVDEGKIAVTDLTPNGSDEIVVLGSDTKPLVRPSGTVVYSGTSLRFRIVGGRYQIDVIGRGISVSAVGKGFVWAQGVSDGVFSVDGKPFKGVLPLMYSDAFGL